MAYQSIYGSPSGNTATGAGGYQPLYNSNNQRIRFASGFDQKQASDNALAQTTAIAKANEQQQVKQQMSTPVPKRSFFGNIGHILSAPGRAIAGVAYKPLEQQQNRAADLGEQQAQMGLADTTPSEAARMSQTVTRGPVANVVKPATEMGLSLAKGLQKIGGLPIEKIRQDIATNTNNPAAYFASKNREDKGVKEAIGFGRFLPRAGVQIGESFNPRGGRVEDRTVTPRQGAAKFLLGNEPVPSLQNVYKAAKEQTGSSGSAASTVFLTTIADLLALKGGVDTLKGGITAGVEKTRAGLGNDAAVNDLIQNTKTSQLINQPTPQDVLPAGTASKTLPIGPGLQPKLLPAGEKAPVQGNGFKLQTPEETAANAPMTKRIMEIDKQVRNMQLNGTTDATAARGLLHEKANLIKQINGQPLDVADLAHQQTVSGGGTTIDTAGGVPSKGYAYAPSKGTEVTIPTAKLTLADFQKFERDNAELLSKPGNHIGSWSNPEDGMTYLDVSRVGEPSAKTIAEAHGAQQLSVYDLEHGNTIDTGQIDKNGVYSPLDEASRIHDKYQEQIARPSGSGSVQGTSEIPQNVPAETSPATAQGPVTPPEYPKSTIPGLTPLGESGATTPGAVTNLTGLGIPKFVKEDVVPAAKTVGEIGKEIKDTLSPRTASEETKAATSIVREGMGQARNLPVAEAARNKAATKFFGKNSSDENIAAISEYEKTGKFPNEPAPGYSEFYKQRKDAEHALLQQALGKDKVGYIENHVSRFYKFGSAEDAARGNTVLSKFIGSKTMAQSRVLDVPLEDALKAMRDRGIKVDLVEHNPEKLAQLSYQNAAKLNIMKLTGETLKKEDLIIKAEEGHMPPEGKVPVSDATARMLYPHEATPFSRYYASPDVAQALDHVTEKGLQGSKTYQGFRATGNIMIQLQHAVPMFHAVFTSIEAGHTDLTLGIRQLVGGLSKGDLERAGEGLKSLGRSASLGVHSSIADVYKGSEIYRGYIKNDPEMKAIVDNSLNPAGGSLRIDSQYKTSFKNNFKEALANGNLPKALIDTPGALADIVSDPLMNHMIPNLKLGAFSRMAEDIDMRIAHGETLNRTLELQKAWDNVDDRFGQMVYDNLFMNKVGKDLAMAATRSVGWNLGSLRSGLGGLSDILKSGASVPKAIVGKGDLVGLTDRAVWAATLPVYAGAIGAVVQYLYTGHGPTQLLDYFYPRTGGTDKNGNPERVQIPSYMKDVFAYKKDPVGTLLHKASPGLSIISAIAGNKDYYGNLVRNPEDKISKQLQQAGEYILKNGLTPFAAQSYNTMRNEGASVKKAGLSFLGLNKAPASVTKSGFEQNLNDALNKVLGSTPQTPEEQALANAKTQAKVAYGRGDASKLNQLVNSGQITQRTADGLKGKATKTSLQNGFDLLFTRDKVQAAKLLKGASSSDIAQLGDTHDYLLKAANEMRNPNALPATRDAAKQIIQLLGGNPNDTRGLYAEYLQQQKQQARQNRGTSRQKSLINKLFKQTVQ